MSNKGKHLTDINNGKEDGSGMGKTKPLWQGVVWMMCFAVGFTALTGCGAKEEVPQLIEPVAIGSNYRPAVYGQVGDILTAEGIVVPRNYCHFFDTNSSVDTILVDVGEYVTEGQTLALADVEQAQKELEALQEEIDSIKQEQDIRNSIFDQSQKMYQLQKKEAKTEGNQDTVKQLSRQLATLKENNRYDKLLAEYQMGKLAERREKLNKIIMEGTIRARHSGYVTYVKDVLESNQVQPLENIVIVSDYEDVFLELPDITVDEEKYTECEYIYVFINGKRYPVSDMAYSEEELAKVNALKRYPKLSFRLPDHAGQEVGARISVCFCKEDKSHVLKIGKDSLYQEGDRYFVYVKTDENAMERRDVELGEQDNNYAEVLSGLSEGELVYYQSAAIPPTDAKEYKIALSDYALPVVLSTGFRVTDQRLYPVYSSQEGTITGVKAADGDVVKKGDLIAVLRVGEGASELAAANNAIRRLEESHKESEQIYKKQEKDLKKQIKAAEAAESKEAESVSEDSTEEISEGQTQAFVEENAAAQAESNPEESTQPQEDNSLADMPESVEIMKCRLAILQLEHKLEQNSYRTQKESADQQYADLKKQYNGDGTMNLYADRDGTITAITVKEGSKIKAGACIYTISRQVSKKYEITMSSGGPDNKQRIKPAGLNEKVDFISSERQGLQSGENARVVTSGRCVGIQADSDTVYVQTVDGQIYFTKCADMAKNGFFVMLEDEGGYDSRDITGVRYENDRMEGVVALPAGMVYEETDNTNGSKKQYVWQMVDGVPVKQYIVTGPSDAGEVVVLSGISEGDSVLGH